MRFQDPPGTGAVVVVATAALVLALASGAAIAGDNVALFSFEPDEIEADPGEEVTVEVVMASHGGYGGEGATNVSFAVDYDPSVLSVTDLEAEPWLEGEDGAEVVAETERDEEAGEVWLNQSREPPGEGATGTAPIATATIEVREDADPTNTTLTVSGSSVTFATGDPQSTMVRDAVVVVAGGAPESDGGADGEDDPEGVTLAEDANGTDGADEADDATVDEGEDGAENDTDSAEETDDDPPSMAFMAAGAIGLVVLAGVAAIALRGRDPGV